ncbi:MAG: transcription initiation protein [Fibrobacteres bacterium]|nr:transcription initiation protein [Fibrobacterota bacterium]
MRQFALIFRMDILTPDAQPSPEQMRLYMEQWAEWIEWIRSQGRLEGGNHFHRKGKVLRPGGVVENSPYAAESISVAGYIVVSAKDQRDAVRLASKCPILSGESTSVEVRELAGPG